MVVVIDAIVACRAVRDLKVGFMSVRVSLNYIFGVLIFNESRVTTCVSLPRHNEADKCRAFNSTIASYVTRFRVHITL